MATPLRKQDYLQVKDYNRSPQQQVIKYKQNKRTASIQKKRSKKKFSVIALIFQIAFLALFVTYIAPKYMDAVIRPTFLRTQKYPHLTTNMNKLANPTSQYLHNNNVLGTNLLSATASQKPEMQQLYETYSLPNLENSLQNLASKYPTLKPSIYVWDYVSGKYANLNSDEVYPAASIIKIPVLIQTFKAIEMGMLKLEDKIAMTPYYNSSGSGSLQFKGENAIYTVDQLARVMITESDNSATNMLLDATGGINAMNQSLRKWGLKETRINDWLPDLPGTNVTTAKEMASLIYNIDNPNFFTINSREKMIDYMSHVHNDRLIQAGLPSDAIFIHKTGDIGKMLGDAGVVYTPNGKKYIVVMLVNRPYNSYQGKEFIVEASTLIYNYMLYSNL